MTTAIKNSSFLNYEIGLIRHFGLKDVYSIGMTGDWAAPEDEHIWNDGPSVSLALKVLSPVTERLVLHFEGRPFLGGSAFHQDVSAYANGHRLGMWRLRESKSYEMTAEIWPEHWFANGTQQILKLDWLLPNSVSAKALGVGDDIRELGLGFTTFSLLRI